MVECTNFRQALRLILSAPLLLILMSSALSADSATILSHRVDSALRSNDNLNGAQCYTAAPGVIVLYGTVFDANDRELAQSRALTVRGVKQVVNTLHTQTGEWRADEARINDTLALNDLSGVSVRIIGNQAYVSGQVTGAANKQRALRVISSVSNLQVVDFIRVMPGSVF